MLVSFITTSVWQITCSHDNYQRHIALNKKHADRRILQLATYLLVDIHILFNIYFVDIYIGAYILKNVNIVDQCLVTERVIDQLEFGKCVVYVSLLRYVLYVVKQIN